MPAEAQAEKKIITIAFDEQEASVACALMSLGMFVLDGRVADMAGATIVVLGTTQSDGFKCRLAEAHQVSCPIHDPLHVPAHDYDEAIEVMKNGLLFAEGLASRVTHELAEFSADWRKQCVAKFPLRKEL